MAQGSSGATETVQDLALAIRQANGGEPAATQFTFHDERGAILGRTRLLRVGFPAFVRMHWFGRRNGAG